MTRQAGDHHTITEQKHEMSSRLARFVSRFSRLCLCVTARSVCFLLVCVACNITSFQKGEESKTMKCIFKKKGNVNEIGIRERTFVPPVFTGRVG